MKIIDRNSGQRVQNKTLSKTDPIKRNVEKGLEDSENSPMDPPGAYEKQVEQNEGGADNAHPSVSQFEAEHKNMDQHVDDFEHALKTFKESGYQFTPEINEKFSAFFEFFDDHILPHNRLEERTLFPVLQKRLLETGEHSTGESPKTAIDLMEDDHIKFIQLGALTFNLLGLGTRIPDRDSGMIVMDSAFNSGRELVEMLRLHVFREDNTLFPLAQKLLSESDWLEVENAMQTVQ